MKGDFTGFSFDGIHCSELGITRVANGDRYDEELFPEISDRSSEIIGADGENYFGSEYRKKPFSISIAFDSITETQFRKIRKLFGTKKICELIFDERPYKVYSVKLESPIELNYICFDEHKRHPGETIKGGGIRYVDKDGQKIREDITPWVYEYDDEGAPVTERIYKGEGSIELVAYSPFAKQLYKKLDLYTDNNIITKYENVDEWAESSGLLTAAAFDRYNIDRTTRTISATIDEETTSQLDLSDLKINHLTRIEIKKVNTEEYKDYTDYVFDSETSIISFNEALKIGDVLSIEYVPTITDMGGYNLKIPVYNPGDLDTGFYLYIPFDSFEEEGSDSMVIPPETTDGIYYLSHIPASGSTPTIVADPTIIYRVDEQDTRKYYITNSDTENPANISFTYNFMGTPVIKPNTGDYVKIFGDENGLLLNPIIRKTDVETGVIINTVNHLIEGVVYDPITERDDYREKTWEITHNIYNECIVAGDFPKILRSDWLLDNEDYKQAIYLNCEAGAAENIQINYDYLYF